MAARVIGFLRTLVQNDERPDGRVAQIRAVGERVV